MEPGLPEDLLLHLATELQHHDQLLLEVAYDNS